MCQKKCNCNWLGDVDSARWMTVVVQHRAKVWKARALTLQMWSLSVPFSLNIRMISAEDSFVVAKVIGYMKGHWGEKTRIQIKYINKSN